MRSLSDREKRTIRIAGILLGSYLVVFVCLKVIGYLEGHRDAYTEARLEARSLHQKMLHEAAKRKRFTKLKAEWNIDFPKLMEKTVVGDARMAIEQTARTCGVGLGFSKETPGRSRVRELAVFKMQGSGKALNVAKFLHCLKTRLGYPLVVDNIHLKAQARPGMVSFTFSAALLNYRTWKSPEKSSA